MNTQRLISSLGTIPSFPIQRGLNEGNCIREHRNDVRHLEWLCHTRSDQVKITKSPSDFAACTAVGNISADSMHNLDPHVAQNKAIGLGERRVQNGRWWRCLPMQLMPDT
jgi:hypothetical protein